MMVRVMLGGTCSLGLMVLLATTGPEGAQARDCAVKPPANATGQWVYRTVEGRKCWYRGPEVIPKADLRWPKEAATAQSARPAPGPAPDSRPASAAKPETAGSQAAKSETERALDANAMFLSPSLPVRLHLPPSNASGATPAAVQPGIQRDSFDARWRGEPR